MARREEKLPPPSDSNPKPADLSAKAFEGLASLSWPHRGASEKLRSKISCGRKSVT
jgi:hypothetical protein